MSAAPRSRQDRSIDRILGSSRLESTFPHVTLAMRRLRRAARSEQRIASGVERPSHAPVRQRKSEAKRSLKKYSRQGDLITFLKTNMTFEPYCGAYYKMC